LKAGDISYSTVSSKGFGDDSGAALRDAIKGAVAQVCGEKIAGSTTVETEAMNSDKGSYSRDKLTDSVRSDTKGIVHSYRIIDEGRADSGRVFVTIEAKVPIYRPSAQTNRLKLAVFPASIDLSIVPSVEVEDIARAMTASIESSLVETRRFAVIDNIGSGPRRKELAKLSAPDVPLSQTLRAAQTMVADYIVLIHIRSFDFGVSARGAAAQAVGATRPMLNMSVDIRIVDVDSGQIKFAMTESVRRRLSGGRSVADYGAILGRGFAKRITGSVYPMVVVSARARTVTLNEGGSNVSVGSKYFLTAAGAEITDPYTGESLGSEELQIAVIQVESVTDRTSSARLVEGEIPLDAPLGALIARPMPVDIVEMIENFRQRSEALQDAIKGKKKDARDDDW
jgi:curli biogenesis system outer membrane secretion channel CsgG